VVGGLSIEEQAFKLREGTEIIIGTPGRLFDVIQKRYLALNVCNYIVLDEADRMIDAGFESQIQAVMDQMPSSNLRPESEEGLETAAAADGGPDEGDHPDQGRYRQTIMFSATMPPRVEALAKKYLRHPVFISVGDREKAASRVEQRVEWLTSEGAKRGRLLELVQQSEMPLIIFTNLKKNCDSITKWLSGIGIGSVSLHGSKSQDDRMSALAAFKAAEVPVLVATDVAGRGLDVQGVKHVINYDLPDNRDGGGIEKYTHRIGRTGRAGLTGLATSFLLETDTDIMYDLANILRASNQPIPPQLAKHEAALMPPGSVSQGAPKPKGVQYSNR
jgi:ATP-dependent RNA helicase DDX23/PRP28